MSEQIKAGSRVKVRFSDVEGTTNATVLYELAIGGYLVRLAGGGEKCVEPRQVTRGWRRVGTVSE